MRLNTNSKDSQASAPLMGGSQSKPVEPKDQV